MTLQKKKSLEMRLTNRKGHARLQTFSYTYMELGSNYIVISLLML
jgi:hypothetical protein